MRDSVLGFNQNKAVQAKLDLTDLMLLQYIMIANGTPDMKHVVKGDTSYVWLSHAKIQEDLPILNIAEGTLRNKLSDLKKNDWIVSETVRTSKGATTYYSISIKAMSLINDVGTENEEPCHSEMTCPCHSEMTSDNKLKDNKLNIDNFTNVKLEQPAVTPQPKRRVRLVDTPNNSVNENTVNQDKSKRKNKYQNCMDIIYEVFEDEDLRKILTVYLPVRLAMKDKPIFADGWRRLLNTLKDMSDDNATRVKIVEQSIDNGWGKFVRLKKYNNYKRIGEQDKSVFSEYGQVKSEKRANEVIMNVQF